HTSFSRDWSSDVCSSDLPETLIEDRPTAFGRWQPQNFDHHFRGTVSLKNALIWSLNIPVVKLAEAVGPNRIAQALRRGGIELRQIGRASCRGRETVRGDA